ncbi:MAG TPA: sensor histidine kinase KdpD [Candidatus Limnocylindrales bacterium]|jgi:two-component system sensor histidine kinase KdpD|nr:sensor histidine kinase KdpD [Candidatus Limnocylindrales bacterium]
MAEPERPNPDTLLAALQKEEASKKRGRLKVFFGMAPGVGKTYAMLEAARRELSAGRGVIIGYVETHGRKETDALVEGLPIVPRLRLEYRGVELTEMDLDGLLAHRPQLALVDELAHTNASGSRHPKRYQDVLELLDAGIDVFTTLNVQHVESRAEAVRQITGVTIRETLPDTILDGAEFELVDLPPEELRARLVAGKVYMPEAAGAAQENFFRAGNLTALRELALRFAAEHVGQDVLAYRHAHGVADPWKSGQRLLVAVSASPTSASLVRWTRRLAGELQAPWLAAYVELPRPLNAGEQTRLSRHLALARELGAQVITTTDDNVARGLLRIAREQNATQIVVGKPVGWRALDLLRGGSLLNRLIRDSGHIDIHALRAEGDAPILRGPAAPRFDAGAARGYWLALGVVAGVTLLNEVLKHWLNYQSLALIYLLSVVVLAMFVARGPTLVAATLTAMLWNFLFVDPLYTFRITEVADLMLFCTYFVVALAMGNLAARLREQQAAERRREQRATALYLLTRELAQASDFADLLAIIIREVGKAAQADTALSLPEESQESPLTPYFASTWALQEKEQSVASWAFSHRQPAGRGTDTLPSAEGLHLPLTAGERAVGVLSLRFRDPALLTTEQRDLLEAFVRQIGLVLDRQRLRDAEQQAKLVSESERLSKTLLNSISHEIRTPIAAIRSAASNLGERGQADSFQREMVAEIQEASQRLNRLVSNLLNMTRLESGHVKANLDWCDLADLVQVTLKEIHHELAGHEVTLQLPPGLPLVKIDFVLMQQALTNLLLNVVVHTPAGSPVEVSARVEAEHLLLTVADRGPGLPPETLPLIFEKFYRAPSAPAGGTGLGLAIVKGLVEAQGGSITAENRPGGGAAFILRLLLSKPPPIVSEKDP